MRGYLNRPEETAKTIVDGWLHTGDVGIFDADGYLRIVDRIKDMIIRGGENIYPKEIETALYAHDARARGRRRRAGPTTSSARSSWPTSRCGRRPRSRSRSSTRTAPNGWRNTSGRCTSSVLDALPKNPVGKIDKPALRRLADT